MRLVLRANLPAQLCNRLNGNRFWVEITYVGGFNTAAQKKADSQGKSSFVQNFDAYLESKSIAACLMRA